PIAAATSFAPVSGVGSRCTPATFFARTAADWILVPPTSTPTVMVPSVPPSTMGKCVWPASAATQQYRSGRPSRIGLVAALAELVADDHPLDLGGALPDAVDPEL